MNGTRLTVPLKPSSTVAELRQQVEDTLNMAGFEQRLFFLGKELVDGALRMDVLGVKPGSVVQLPPPKLKQKPTVGTSPAASDGVRAPDAAFTETLLADDEDDVRAPDEAYTDTLIGPEPMMGFDPYQAFFPHEALRDEPLLPRAAMPSRDVRPPAT